MLSIVFGTYNRLDMLTDCMEALRAAVSIPHEIIILDGGSTDGTLEYLRNQPDVRLIAQGRLVGAVKAYNAGFDAAIGDYVAFINDDLVLAPGQLDAAVNMLNARPDVGMVALRFYNVGKGNGSDGGHTGHIKFDGKRIPYAEFGVIRNDLGRQVGWFTDRYFHYAGDSHLGMSVWRAGYRVEPLNGYCAKHMHADNALRGANRWQVDNKYLERAGNGTADGRKFYAYWGNCDWWPPEVH